MTDEIEQEEDENEVSQDIQDALSATGKVEPESESVSAEADGAESQSKIGGLVDKVGSLQGSGKSLDSYEEDPIASIWADDETGDVPKGAKHIARGVDGLSPLGSAHPLIDIGVGFVLLKAENEMRTDSSDDDDDGDISDSNGEMLT